MRFCLNCPLGNVQPTSATASRLSFINACPLVTADMQENQKTTALTARFAAYQKSFSRVEEAWELWPQLEVTVAQLLLQERLLRALPLPALLLGTAAGEMLLLEVLMDQE